MMFMMCEHDFVNMAGNEILKPDWSVILLSIILRLQQLRVEPVESTGLKVARYVV